MKGKLSRIAWLLVIAGALQSPCVAAQQPEREPVETPKLLRDLGALSVAVLDDARDGNGTHFRMRISDARTRRQRHFTVDDKYVSRIDEIHNYANQKIVLLGATGSGEAIIIVDVAKGAAVDSFPCFSPAVSGDGRFVAYRRFLQRSAPIFSDVAIVYDVSKPPAENRPSGGALQDVGWPVYPQANVAERKYAAEDGYSPLDGVVHGLGSPPTWVGEKQLALVDLSERRSRLVVVDLAQGVASPRIAEVVLDPAELINMEHVEQPDKVSSLLTPQVVKRVPGDEFRLRLGFGSRPELRVTWLDVVIAPEKFAPVPPLEKR